MPIYEYECKACRGSFEKLVRTSADRDAVRCPSCGSERTGRKLSAVAVGASSGGGKAEPRPAAGPGCGRCGGPNPCGMG